MLLKNLIPAGNSDALCYLLFFDLHPLRGKRRSGAVQQCIDIESTAQQSTSYFDRQESGQKSQWRGGELQHFHAVSIDIFFDNYDAHGSIFLECLYLTETFRNRVAETPLLTADEGNSPITKAGRKCS